MPGESDQTKWRGIRHVHPVICDIFAPKTTYTESKAAYVSGTYDMNFSAVPAGEIWILKNVVSALSSASAVNMTFQKVKNSSVYFFNSVVNPPANSLLVADTIVLLEEGDYLRIWFNTLSGTSWIYGTVLGWKIALY